MKVVLWLLLTPIILVLLGITGTELNKAYWDWQVRKMCEKDGGVTVYETVMLTKKEFLMYGGTKGGFPIPSKDTSQVAKNSDFPYETRWKSMEINRHSPRVWKTEATIYRKADGKRLGKSVSFSRRGGDFPTGLTHASSFSCRSFNEFDMDLVDQIFVIEGE